MQESKKKEDKKYTSQAEIDQKLRELDRAKQKVPSLPVQILTPEAPVSGARI